MTKSALISEAELGTDQLCEDFEKSYILSCEHNKTNPDDLEYFREYIWNLFAVLTLKLNEVFAAISYEEIDENERN